MYKNIVLHWTAGGYTPNNTDLTHYHYVIDGQGGVHTGKYKPEDNLNCNDGRYAAHCGGGNTGRIGISICCMKDKYTTPTRKQVEAMCNLAAQLCHVYGLHPLQCITHAEFGQAHPKTTSFGKIDINELPYAGIKGITNTAQYIRNKIQWYFNKYKE